MRLRLLSRFDGDPAFESLVDPPQAESFLLAALIHDIGHWPFCHLIEDMQLSDLGEHESRVASWLETPELREAIDSDWSCTTADVVRLLHPTQAPAGARQAAAQEFLRSCLSGPIDIDKLDYLQRDSLHAGVPYGRNFDAESPDCVDVCPPAATEIGDRRKRQDGGRNDGFRALRHVQRSLLASRGAGGYGDAATGGVPAAESNRPGNLFATERCGLDCDAAANGRRQRG